MKEDWLKQYEGAIERWKLNLAVSRFKAFRIPPQDWRDMMQELAMVLIRFRHRPAKSNGAKPETALCTVINRRLCAILRGPARDQERIDARIAELGLTGDPEADEQKLSYEEPTALQLDVRQQLAAMTPFEQAVCREVVRCKNTRRIAKKLDCDWHTVRRTVMRICRKLEAGGLHGYVKKGVAS